MRVNTIRFYALFVCTTLSLHATTLKETVEFTLKNNTEIQSILENDKAFKYYVDEEIGGYLPTIDVTAYLRSKETEFKNADGSTTDARQEGYNATVDIEQMIYDGGLTPSKVDEAEYQQLSNEFNNKNRLQNILLESIQSYLNMVKSDEKRMILEERIAIYDKYLNRAKENEEISGEALDTFEVSAKIHSAKNSLYQEIKNKNFAISGFERSVGVEPKGLICRPVMDGTVIGNSKKALVEKVLNGNYEMLEQVNNIKEQRATLNQSKAAFLPTLAFKAQAYVDDDLLTNNVRTSLYSGRIELSYNLFNGTKDYANKQREVAFLNEAQKTLDTVTKSVIDRVNNAFDRYDITKKQIEELTLFIEDNQHILMIYKDQFDGGTRQFIDILDAENDILTAMTNLVETEYEMMGAYYEILVLMSNLDTTVLSSQNQVCTAMKKREVQVPKDDPSIEDLNDLLEK